ncbi:MAG: acyl carrier protein [Eubacteriales bacterium]
MNRAEILEAINKVFWDVFDDEDLVIIETTTAEDIEDWDSLEHINLIVAIEDQFQMKFTMGEVTGMKNVGEMISIIAERI